MSYYAAVSPWTAAAHLLPAREWPISPCGPVACWAPGHWGSQVLIAQRGNSMRNDARDPKRV